MIRKNRYYRRTHISEATFKEILRYFCRDLTASTVAEVTGVGRPTVNKVYLKLRARMAALCEAASPLSGEVAVDESYFGSRRVRGKRGRGAGGIWFT